MPRNYYYYYLILFHFNKSYSEPKIVPSCVSGYIVYTIQNAMVNNHQMYRWLYQIASLCYCCCRPNTQFFTILLFSLQRVSVCVFSEKSFPLVVVVVVVDRKFVTPTTIQIEAIYSRNADKILPERSEECDHCVRNAIRFIYERQTLQFFNFVSHFNSRLECTRATTIATAAKYCR